MTDTEQAPTPRTTALREAIYEVFQLSYKLERELAQASADIEQRDRRIAKLESTLKVCQEGNSVWRDRRDAAMTEAEALRERCERLEQALHRLLSPTCGTEEDYDFARAALAERKG